MQKKLLKRIVGLTVQGQLVKVGPEGKVYRNGKHFYIVDSEGNETKHRKEWVTELHKANAYNGAIQIIPV